MIRVKTECEKTFYIGNKLNYGMTLFSQLLGAALSIALAFMLQFFIEAVEFASEDLIYKGAYLFLLYLVIYAVFSLLHRNYKNKYMQTALSQFKDYIFQKMLGKSIAQFGNGTSAKFISAFSNDLNSIETNYLNGNVELISTALQFFAASIAIIYINWIVAIPVLTVALICIFLSLKYGKKLVEKESETSDENMGFVSQVKDLLNGFIVIKSFKAEKEVLDIFRTKNAKLEKTKQGRRVTSDTVNIYGDISSIIVNIFILGLGFFLAFKGNMTIGMVIALIQLGNYILAPVRNLAPLISNRSAAIGLITRLSEEVEASEETEEGTLLNGFEDKISFENVIFSYEQDKEVLNNVTVTFDKGKSYAIVGGSGSGKSTLLKLMLGYHQDYTGNILFDGIQMKDIDLTSLYDMMSIIQQDVFLFDSSIKDNITMFRTFDANKLQNALKRSGLSELVVEKGDDYSCGEGGKNLSGGEKQRVSIARCLIRDTPILLMDEATAALDNATALMVENAILDIGNLTRIIVTHRFSEIVMNKYDEIIVMNKGKVIEKGHFKQLMEEKGYFYSLYNVSQTE